MAATCTPLDNSSKLYLGKDRMGCYFPEAPVLKQCFKGVLKKAFVRNGRVYGKVVASNSQKLNFRFDFINDKEVSDFLSYIGREIEVEYSR